MDIILTDLAIVLLAGIIFEKVATKLKLPNIVGYIMAGLLLGSSILNITSPTIIKDVVTLSNILLGFIAFSIGDKFNKNYFKQIGAIPIVITIFQAWGAMLFVTTILLLFKINLVVALMLGALATATSVKSTVLILQQYNSKGYITEVILKIGAIDDVVCLISVGIISTIAQSISVENNSVGLMVVQVVQQIIGSLIIGILFSYGLKYFIMWITNKIGQVLIIMAIIMISITVTDIFGFSSLLSCIAMGAMYNKTHHINFVTEKTIPLFYMLFFIVSAAELNLDVLSSIRFVGFVYIVFRVVGKILGTRFITKIINSPLRLEKNFALTFVPQEEVIIILAFLAENIIPEYAMQTRAIILCSTFIYSMISPTVTECVLKKLGEIN
ncbi:sodium:proton exchanger [Candidatus Epulonipiscioides gigas]|nr:sodium:proton exchanger [Epulopiscium sp. SCG-C07WGA-EpuloA2]